MGATISARDCEIGLVFQRLKTGKSSLLHGYIDANYPGDLDQRRSTTGYMLSQDDVRYHKICQWVE